MTIHLMPANPSDNLPCCHQGRWDVSLLDRLTDWPPRVTCPGPGAS